MQRTWGLLLDVRGGSGEPVGEDSAIESRRRNEGISDISRSGNAGSLAEDRDPARYFRRGHPMKYDDASWHSEGEFPSDSPIERGGTHIGLFLRWCFGKGWASSFHVESDSASDVKAVIAGTLSGTEFLFQWCDGKLTDEDLNEDGNDFANAYYGRDGLYLQDYAAVFDGDLYKVPEADHDFTLYSRMLDERLRSGILTKSDL